MPFLWNREVDQYWVEVFASSNLFLQPLHQVVTKTVYWLSCSHGIDYNFILSCQLTL